VFVEFFYELRKRGVKVGPQELLTVAEALSRDLHETTLDGFYEVARALCVHREQDLDAFDTAFASYFHGIELEDRFGFLFRFHCVGSLVGELPIIPRRAPSR
jgi:uncharacterized protein with von Willebrand factor type A (vWA) domain